MQSAVCATTVLLVSLSCAEHTHAGIVFTQWSKNGFIAPQGRHVTPINVKFRTGERPLHRAKFHVYRGTNVGIQRFYSPQNCQNFEFSPGATRLHKF